MTPQPPQRYWLFANSMHYPDGGWHDLRGTYATLDAASAAARAYHAVEDASYSWHHIVDSQTGQIVAGTRVQGAGTRDLTPEEGGA